VPFGIGVKEVKQSLFRAICEVEPESTTQWSEAEVVNNDSEHPNKSHVPSGEELPFFPS
jgi:hypothetical protein